MGAYTKGPGKGEESVKKVFKTGSVYEDTFFQKDVKAVVEDTEALESIEASDRFSTDSLKRALAVLGLDGQPSDREIKKAYRLKALKCHPDKLPVHLRRWGAEKMKELNWAYDVLTGKKETHSSPCSYR